MGAAMVSLRLPGHLLAALAALLVLAGVTGCSPHLAGTNDAELEYQVPAGIPTEVAAAGVKARLSSALVAAEVDAAGERVRVVVDADVAGSVDGLVRWRGGVTAYLVDESRELDPSHPAETPTHVHLTERLPGGGFRTRGALLPPIVTFGLSQTPITSIRAAQHGRALAFTFAPAALAPLEQLREAHPDALVAIARDTSVLETVPVSQALVSPLVVSFGDDLAAFTRAYHTKLVLASPILPQLTRIEAARVRPSWGVAAACAILPFALSFAWLSFVRRFDRVRPEPMWLVLATFALGCLSIVPAGLIEAGLAKLSPWLDPGLVTMGGQAWALPIAIPVFTLCIGAVEEGTKMLAAWSLAGHRREFDEPVDGIVYGSAAALGFAAVENVKYFAIGRMAGTVISLRAFVSVPAHLFFGAIWGYALGQKLVSRRTNVPLFFGLAALAHGTFDALLSTDGAALYAGLLVVGLAIAFTLALRRALRHGAVPQRPHEARGAAPRTEPLPASTLQRAYFHVGSPAAFVVCASGMVVCAFAMTILGTVYEVFHHRVGVVFVALASLLLGALGAFAHGVSSAIPLDVAIDAHGVTFSGARTPWNAIGLVDLEPLGRRAVVRLHTMDGVVRLGPTRPANAEAIAAAIRAAKT
jgi:RsiW-degrading membrane proteinase PrsW (M82 family)